MCSYRNKVFFRLVPRLPTPNRPPPSVIFQKVALSVLFYLAFSPLGILYLYVSPFSITKTRKCLRSLASLSLFLCPDSGLPSASRSDCWRGCGADTHNKARLGWKCSRVPAGGCESRVPAGERSDPAGSSAQPGLSRQREPTAPNHGQPWKLQLNLKYGSGPKHGASRN